ncbi:hypothetical protein [Hymenobacter sp. DG25A]|uniref:hypothetical protein n=1 Tax=Hymenobacter sp. DG25A TaxID=1385663 RepID=UPI0006BC7F6A|nr:hypothetical protein [Hymenobacter sp. DG25A]ALD21485.1 hypothetical protein AM218_10015 [Hymenobacter sp. DG25A]
MDYTLPNWLQEVGSSIYWICQFALLYPLWVAWQRREYWTLPVQILFWVLVALEINCFFLNTLNLLSLNAEFIAMFELPSYGISTWGFAHLQSNIRCLGFIGVYYYALQSQTIRRVLHGWIPVLVLIALFDSFYFNPFLEFKHNEYTEFSQNITVIVLCLLYFEQLLQQLRTSQIEREPMFWISISAIVQLTGVLVFGNIINKMLADTNYTNGRNYQALFGLVHSSVTLVSYGLLTLAFYQLGRQQKMVLK